MTYEDIAKLDAKGQKFFQDYLKTGKFSISNWLSGGLNSIILPLITSDGENFGFKKNYFENNYYSGLANGEDDHYFMAKDLESHKLHLKARSSAEIGTEQLLNIFFQMRGREKYIFKTNRSIIFPRGAT